VNKGLYYTPIHDALMGVFCWQRNSDQQTTLWEVGQDAIELFEWCKTAEPHEIDFAAQVAFAEMEKNP